MELKKIASFTIDHIRMSRGVFVSRVDEVNGEKIVTFDIRMKEPNREPVMDIPALHSIEHLGATYLRNHPTWADRTIYFGPMGCRTGCYMILRGVESSQEALPIVRDMMRWILGFEGEVPGAAARDCGNWRDHNLDMAKWEARKFLTEVLENPKPENFNYPE
jgi:S-ribosylhomocysteine lyase